MQVLWWYTDSIIQNMNATGKHQAFFLSLLFIAKKTQEERTMPSKGNFPAAVLAFKR